MSTCGDGTAAPSASSSAALHAQLRVDAGDDHVEAREQVVVEVERAVLVDVDLHAGEDAERAPSSALSSATIVELLQQALAVEPVGDRQAGRVVGQHHVLVTEGDAVAAIASIVAPPSLHVECRWQSPRSASRYALALGA